MKTLSNVFVIVLIFSSILSAQSSNPPKREFRAAWVATVTNIDWPTSKGLTSFDQQNQAIAILDKHKANNINAILLQVRPSCDAMYQGGLEPLSEWLAGTQGGNLSQYYDPLKFWIDEAHKRGMELHAWFNPYRSVVSSGSSVHNSHISKTKPEWNINYGSSPFKFLNPGIPEVQNYVASVIMDVVRRYDIDGVHFDDYFYPYGGMGSQDTAAYNLYKGSFTNIGDWRRNNVNKFVAMVYDSIKATKSWVKFGISPFGIWKSGQPVPGLDAYSAIYCDAINWIQNKKLDYVTPQMYWKIAGAQDYSVLMPWWSVRTNGRHLYTGNAVYRLTDVNFTTENNASEIQNQIEMNRVNNRAQGFVAFSSKSITNNLKGVQDSLRNNQFRYTSLPPVMPWLDSVAPLAPVNLSALLSGSNINLQWEKGPLASDNDTSKYYVVYSAANQMAELQTDASQYIRYVSMNGSKQYSLPVANPTMSQFEVVVTAFDKLWNESPATTRAYVAPAGKPYLSLKTLSVDLGNVAIGSTAIDSFYVYNRSANSLIIDSTYVSSNIFSASPKAISIQDSSALNVSFSPTAFGIMNDTVIIKNNSVFSIVKIAVKGNSPRPTLKLVSNSVNYGNGRIGDSVSKPVFITNQSLNTIIVDSIGFVPTSKGYFAHSNNTFPVSIVTGDTASLNTLFIPDSIKLYIDTLVVYSNATNSPQKVILFGIGQQMMSVDPRSGLQPMAYDLQQNYPNPFNPTTTIQFVLQKSGSTTLKIYDMLGREITTIVDENLDSGTHTYQFNGSHLASGVYLYRIISGDFVQTRKMVIQK